MMPKFTDKAAVSGALQDLGTEAELADALADEQIEHDVPHVATTSFLKIVNSFVCSLDEPESLTYVNSLPDDELKHNEFAAAVKRMLDLGVSPLDIKTVIREMQYDLLEEVFSLLDNVSNYDEFPVDEFNLYAINDETNEPETLIDGLHECIYTMKEW